MSVKDRPIVTGASDVRNLGTVDAGIRVWQDSVRLPRFPPLLSGQNIYSGVMSIHGFPTVPIAEPTFAIKVQTEDDYFVASDTATGIFGVGKTLAEAFSDFGDALIEHRDVLERHEQLSPGLADQLEYLRQRVPR